MTTTRIDTADDSFEPLPMPWEKVGPYQNGMFAVVYHDHMPDFETNDDGTQPIHSMALDGSWGVFTEDVADQIVSASDTVENASRLIPIVEQLVGAAERVIEQESAKWRGGVTAVPRERRRMAALADLRASLAEYHASTGQLSETEK